MYSDFMVRLVTKIATYSDTYSDCLVCWSAGSDVTKYESNRSFSYKPGR